MVFDRLSKKETELEARMETARGIGAEVSRAGSLLSKAKELMGARKFEEAIVALSAASTSISTATEVKKRYADLKLRCESMVETARRRGLKLEKAAVLFAQAEKDAASDMTAAIAKMEKALALASKEMSAHLPNVSLSLDFLGEPSVERWTQVRINLRNEGSIGARDLGISLSGEVEVKGLTRLDELKKGEKTSIELEIRPRAKGSIPVRIALSCRPEASEEVCGFESTFEMTVQ